MWESWCTEATDADAVQVYFKLLNTPLSRLISVNVLFHPARRLRWLFITGIWKQLREYIYKIGGGATRRRKQMQRHFLASCHLGLCPNCLSVCLTATWVMLTASSDLLYIDLLLYYYILFICIYKSFRDVLQNKSPMVFKINKILLKSFFLYTFLIPTVK